VGRGAGEEGGSGGGAQGDERCDMTTAASLDGGSVGGSHRVRVVGLLEVAALVDIEAMGWR
jgi:hypothetical protein